MIDAVIQEREERKEGEESVPLPDQDAVLRPIQMQPEIIAVQERCRAQELMMLFLYQLVSCTCSIQPTITLSELAGVHPRSPALHLLYSMLRI